MMKKNNYKISIVTPSYNQGKFIIETFDSILSQGIKNLEYIVMDGGSTDSTLTIADRYRSLFTKAGISFIFISEKDNGQSDAINKGWKMATGDILTYINSDDYYTRGALKEVLKYFNKNAEVKWAYGGWMYVNEKGNPFLTRQPIDYNRNKLLNYCNIGQPSCFFRRELLDDFGYLNTSLHLTMDYDLWLRFASKYPAGIINKVLSCMRYHKNAKSVELTSKQLLEAYRIGSKYTKIFNWRRIVQLFYLIRGFIVNYLRISKIQRELK